MRLALMLVTLLLASACARHPLPDRDRESVRATEAQLTQVVNDQTGGADCSIRLLGESRGVSFVWAACTSPYGGQLSAPIRIEDGQIELPGDGAQYREDVRRMFPPGLADEILENQDRLRP